MLSDNCVNLRFWYACDSRLPVAQRVRSGSHQWPRWQLGGGTHSSVPNPDVVRDHQRRFDQPMADDASMEEPFDVTRARHGQTASLLLDYVEEGSCRSPDDLDPPIVHLPIDMQVPASNHRDLVPDTHFEQLPTRRVRNGRGGKCRIVRIVFKRRQMLEKHHPAGRSDSGPTAPKIHFVGLHRDGRFQARRYRFQ